MNANEGGAGALSLSGQTSSLVCTKRGFGISAITAAIAMGLTAALAMATVVIALQNSLQMANSL